MVYECLFLQFVKNYESKKAIVHRYDEGIDILPSFFFL